jgi:hypothetical protein
MRAQASFQEILEEKMTQSQPAGQNSTTMAMEPGLFDSDPAHLAFLLGQVNVFRFERPRPQVRPAAPPPPKKQRVRGTDHELSEEQRWSFEWFVAKGERLDPDYTEGELKAAYRRLARRLHPDLNGGDGQAFLELKGQHECLRSVFPN